MTPLMMASKSGYVELVQFLIQEGQAEVNRVDAQGHTAVMHASQEGHLPVVKVLIEKGQADAAMCSPHVRICTHLLLWVILIISWLVRISKPQHYWPFPTTTTK